MKKYILFMFLSLFAFPEQVYAEFDCKNSSRPSCEDLGYMHLSSDCSGGNILRCPFDNTKLFCNKYSYEKCDASSNSNSYLKYAKQCVTSCNSYEHGSCALTAFTSTVSTQKCQVILKNALVNGTYSPTVSTPVTNDLLTLSTRCGSTSASKLKSSYLSDVTTSDIVNLTPGQVLYLHENKYFTNSYTSSGSYIYARYDNNGDGTVDYDDHYFFNLNTGLFDKLTITEIPGKTLYIPCQATVDCETDKDHSVPTLLRTSSCKIGSFNYGAASINAEADGVYCYGTKKTTRTDIPLVVNSEGRTGTYAASASYKRGIVDLATAASSYPTLTSINNLSLIADPCSSKGDSLKSYRLLTKAEMDVVVKKIYDLAGGGQNGESVIQSMGYYLVTSARNDGTVQCYNATKVAAEASQITASGYGNLDSDCSDAPQNIGLSFSYYCVGAIVKLVYDPGLK